MIMSEKSGLGGLGVQTSFGQENLKEAKKFVKVCLHSSEAMSLQFDVFFDNKISNFLVMIFFFWICLHQLCKIRFEKQHCFLISSQNFEVQQNTDYYQVFQKVLDRKLHKMRKNS